MDYIEVEKEFKNIIKYSNCYSIAGDDEFFIGKVINRFCGLVLEYPDINVIRFDESVDINTILFECETLPFGCDYKIVIVSDFNFRSIENKSIENYLKHSNISTILLFVRPRGNVNTNITKIDCNRLSATRLNAFIKEMLVGYCSIDEDATTLLCKYCDLDMLRIQGEINKLISYKSSSDNITINDIELMVVPSINYKVFELSEAIAKKDNDRAINIYNTIIKSGEEPIMLNGLLYSHFRRILMCSLNKNDKASLVQYLGIKEYGVKMALEQSKLYSAKTLINICKEFWKIDNDFRTGKMPLADTTKNIMLSILSV